MRPYLEQMTFLLIISLRAFHISACKFSSSLGISNDGMILVVEVNTILTFFIHVYDSIHILRYINKGVSVLPIILLHMKCFVATYVTLTHAVKCCLTSIEN